MSITLVKELVKKRSASKNKDSRSRTRVFLVKSDTLKDGPVTAESNCGVSLWDAYTSGNDSDATCFCQSISTQEVAPYTWEVTCEYGLIDNDSTCEQNPLTCPVEYSWSSVTTEEVVEETTDTPAEQIINSAGDPFDPSVTRETSRIQLDVSWNSAAFSGSTAFNYCDKVNSNSYSGAAAGTLKVSGIRATTQVHESIGVYWSITISYLYKPDGWQKKVLDQGMRRKDSSNGLVPIVVNGREITNPVPLKDGRVLNCTHCIAGDSHEVCEISGSGEDPQFLEFQVYEEMTF